MMSRYRPLLERIGLTYPQYLAMLALWEQDGRTVSEICLAMGLDTGTVSPLLKRLATAGLLERNRESSDERSVVIRLTEKGRSLENAARAIPGALADCLDLQPDQYAELHDTLSGLLARLQADK